MLPLLKGLHRMERKDRIDAFGAGALITFSLLMGLNQVLIKLVNAGFSPVFQVGLRSACALVPVVLFALWMRRKLTIRDGSLGPGIVCGLLFSGEFLLLFSALDYTAVSRASVLFYTMPVWVALGAHALIPGERLTWLRILGLVFAVTGVAVALLDDAPPMTEHALIGDIMCLVGAMCWGGIALLLRTSRLSRAAPEMQLVYQLTISALILLPIAPLFGPVIRELTPQILLIFSFQFTVIVAFGFLSWFWIMRFYPASDVAAFSFLAPLFGVLASWLILGEAITPHIIGALILVGTGITMINWKPKR